MTSVNQQRIAEMLNISRTTVSRCFTNHPGINPATRSQVFDLASKLGYHHMENRSPSKLRSAQPRKVGVLICTDMEEYFRPDYQSPGVEIYEGVRECAQLHRLEIDLHYVDPADRCLADPSYAKIGALWNRQWDGILLIYPFPRRVVDEIDAKYPVVTLVEQYGTEPVDCVDVDHFKGIATLMNSLAALGHRRIGFYTKSYEVEAGWSFRRFSAYVEKLTRLQHPLIPEDAVNIYPVSFPTLEEGFDHVAGRIRDGVTAWLCAADHQAYDLIAGLAVRGIRVPRDVSVTGFDGIQVPHGSQNLTTAVIPYREIGFTGAKRLRDMIDKRFGSSQHILVSCNIREGATIGPPPQVSAGGERPQAPFLARDPAPSTSFQEAGATAVLMKGV